MYKTAIKYGVRAGILMVVLSWANFYITRSSEIAVAQITSVAVVIIALGFVPAAINSIRKENDNLISFWMAFFTGGFTSLIPAFFMFVSTFIFMMVQRAAYAEWSLGNEAQGITGDAHVVVMRPIEQSVIMFLMVLMLGTLISIASAIFLHKTKHQ
jgi:hypothetical protein